MIPNTFEAYALRGRVSAAEYFAGYVAAIKPRDQSSFVNMAQQAGAPNVDAGMWLATVKYGSLETFGARTSLYHVPDILTSNYNDVAVTFPISDQVRIRLLGQAMAQGSNGANQLTGAPFSTFAAGGRINVIYGPLSVFGAYTQTGSAAAYRTPYGVWLGFTSQQVKDFNRAGERAVQAGAAFDFRVFGWRGLLFVGSATFGDRAIDAATGQPLANTNEYDFELAFRADLQSAPDWLKPLQLRARAAIVDQFLAGTLSSINEYRLYFNYELTFSGAKRLQRQP